MQNRDEIIEFCKNNRTSQRELMELFGFKHRPAVKKFLEENNITILAFTEEERRKRISDAREAKRLEEWSKYDIEKIRKYCETTSTSDRELVNIFGFPGRSSVRGFLDYHNITLSPYTQDEINNKIKETHLNFTEEEKAQIADRRKDSMMKSHNVEYSLQSKEIQDKMKQNNIHKYGYENPFQVEEFKDKIKETMNDKYGVDYPSQSPDIKTKMMKTLSDNEYRSSGEIDLNNWINSIGFKTVKHFVPEYSKSGKYIKSYEIDIFIPEKKVGIEFNGEYWHSDKVLNEKDYHYKKSIAAEKQGYRLIHVHEAYWNQPTKRAIYESIIRNALGAPIIKIRAHKCEIKPITNKEAEIFFNTNHLGGHVPAKLAYGLFYEGEMVQAELFSKPRFNKKIDWESIRGCSKLGYMVYGGYEKVLKYFKSEHNPESIISYVDFNTFMGSLHEHAGFKFKKYTGPDHWYLDKQNNLKRYWIVRGDKPIDMKWAEDRDAGIKYHYWFAGSKVYVWEKEIF